MEKIKLRVSGNVAEITERPEIITSGTVGLPVEFTFDSQWENLTKLAVFQAGDVAMTVAEPEGETVVPWEVLEKPNVWLRIGVYGVNADGSVAIPTMWANVCVIHTGANPNGEPSATPTLTVGQKILNAISDITAETIGAASKEDTEKALEEIRNSVGTVDAAAVDNKTVMDSHIADTENPHGVTAEQVGAAPATLADYTPYNGRKNFCSNLLHIDLDNPDAYVNKAGVVSTEDATTLVDSPITSGAFYAYREVLFINSTVGNGPKVAVRLTETYPQGGRIWINTYNPDVPEWSGWSKFEDSDNFAPAGYGLGETSARRLDITKMSQLDEITAIGWYSFHLPTLLQVNGVWLNYAYMLVENWDVSSVKQTLYVLNNESTTLTRRKFEGIWKEWECENPPMLFGVEYRTTERWNGKPVYAKLVDVDYYVKKDDGEGVCTVAFDVDSLVDAKFTVWNNGYPIGGSYTVVSDGLELVVTLYNGFVGIELWAYSARWSGATLLLKYTKTNTD